MSARLSAFISIYIYIASIDLCMGGSSIVIYILDSSTNANLYTVKYVFDNFRNANLYTMLGFWEQAFSYCNTMMNGKIAEGPLILLFLEGSVRS